MTELGNEIALQAMVDALTERNARLVAENTELRTQLRKTSLLPPPLDDLPSPRDTIRPVEFPSIDNCLPTVNKEGV